MANMFNLIFKLIFKAIRQTDRKRMTGFLSVSLSLSLFLSLFLSLCLCLHLSLSKKKQQQQQQKSAKFETAYVLTQANTYVWWFHLIFNRKKNIDSSNKRYYRFLKHPQFKRSTYFILKFTTNCFILVTVSSRGTTVIYFFVNWAEMQ